MLQLQVEQFTRNIQAEQSQDLDLKLHTGRKGNFTIKPKLADRMPELEPHLFAARMLARGTGAERPLL